MGDSLFIFIVRIDDWFQLRCMIVREEHERFLYFFIAKKLGNSKIDFFLRNPGFSPYSVTHRSIEPFLVNVTALFMWRREYHEIFQPWKISIWIHNAITLFFGLMIWYIKLYITRILWPLEKHNLEGASFVSDILNSYFLSLYYLCIRLHLFLYPLFCRPPLT